MHPAASRAHVLVINNNQAMIDLICDLLKAEGYRVTHSIETMELARLRTIAPDVIVQDVVFEGKSEAGWQLLAMVRLDPELARIPLVLCTGAVETVSNQIMAENLNRHGVRVLIKPFDLDELLSALRDVLTAQHLINQARDPGSDGVCQAVSDADHDD
jgi:CheY-like chemotaxis protein